MKGPSDDLLGGRGLRLVDALSDKWGVATDDVSSGKRVWASFAVGTDDELATSPNG